MKIKIGIMFVMALAVMILAVPAQATVIGFESGEGYSAGDLNGQPIGGIGTWVLKAGLAANVQVAAGVGVTGAGLSFGGGTTDKAVYHLTGIPELSSFDPNASVISYSWQTKFVATGTSANDSTMIDYSIDSNGWSNAAAVRVQHVRNYWWDFNRIQWFYNGGYGYVQYTDNIWHQIDVTTDWATRTYDITIDGTSQGTDLPFQNANAVNSEFVVGSDRSTPLAGYMDNLTIVIPEPGSLFLLGTGLLSLVSLARRKRG